MKDLADVVIINHRNLRFFLELILQLTMFTCNVSMVVTTDIRKPEAYVFHVVTTYIVYV